LYLPEAGYAGASPLFQRGQQFVLGIVLAAATATIAVSTIAAVAVPPFEKGGQGGFALTNKSPRHPKKTPRNAERFRKPDQATAKSKSPGAVVST
jgi:hypothetical protein